ncbi:hypothetical protein CTA2_12788 [Colletotrichum tanaceti]|nr:hypothetical protein CTA2_12788 [Colletotrichum tanaceti]
MRSALIVAAVAGLVTAGPVAPRDASAQSGIDLTVFDATPKPTKTGPAVGVSHEPPTYNPAEAQASAVQDAVANPVIAARSEPELVARASTCTNPNQEPDGYGPVPSPDTYDSFMSWTALDDIANNAPVPEGYFSVFSDLKASVSGSGYQGLYTLTSFDPIRCQQACFFFFFLFSPSLSAPVYCDAAPACYGFNMFMERNPKFTPSDTCVDPESITNYKCTLWGAGVSQASATNDGQWRNQFHVGISGSNGMS